MLWMYDLMTNNPDSNAEVVMRIHIDFSDTVLVFESLEPHLEILTLIFW